MMAKKLTNTQRETIDAVKRLLLQREAVTTAEVGAEMGIKISTARNRLATLEMIGELTGELVRGMIRYRLYDKKKAAERRNEYVKRKADLSRHPITADEVEAIKERMKYRKGKLPGTKAPYLWRTDIDKISGKKIDIVREVEALEPYPHGVLFAGERFKAFVSWADLALHYRHGERKPIGAYYGRDEK